MKRYFHFSAILLAASVALASCSKSEIRPDDAGADAVTSFNAYSEAGLGRTALNVENYGILWNRGDAITVFGQGSGKADFECTSVSVDGTRATFSGFIPSSQGYTAVYPASSSPTLDDDILCATVPSVQRAVDNGFDPAAAVAVAQSGGNDLFFRNVGSLLGVVIRNDGIASVTISAPDFPGVSLTGDFIMDVSDPESQALSYRGVDSVMISGTLTNDNVYYAAVLPGIFTDLKIVFRDKKGRTATFHNPNALTIARNRIIDVIDITVAESDWKSGSSDSGGADYPWPELPAQSDRDRNGIDDNNPDFYYSHTFRADASSIRNFSSCYSKGMAHPVWVAAPMHKCYLGSSGRNDSYKPDPNIGCTQSAKFSGYTRGHMIGSSDRTVSVATNKQAFYYSNIGAQLSSGFNTGGGAWNNLEDRVDSYLCADTLYQVIGCIFETFTDRYGTTVSKKSGSNDAGASFQVPTAWYKVLLRTKKGNSGRKVSQCSASELQCVAFILAHKGNQSHKPTVNDLYTVSEVERLTGLTFFVNVPNAPKDNFTASDWNF